MNHSHFSIGGLEFWCAGKRWLCADIGTRVVVAISLEARDMTRSETDPGDKTKRIESRFVSNDPKDLSGPPYGVVEHVFDENDIEGCICATASCRAECWI